MVQYETIYTNYGESERYMVEELACGNVKRTKVSNQYNDKDGAVVITVDPTIVTAEAIVKGQLKRKAQAKLKSNGSREQKHRYVMAKFERLEQDDDNGRA